MDNLTEKKENMLLKIGSFCILAFLAFYLTLKVSATESYPVGVRILLSVVLLAGGWLLLLLLAVLMSLALG